MTQCNRQFGIGVFGLIVVMLVVGLLMAGLTPFFLTKDKRIAEDSDRAALEAAKTAIIGYAMTNGRLPTPDAATARCPVGVMPANLGANHWGRFGRENPFCMDTNTALRGTTVPKALCAAARSQLAAPPATTFPLVDIAPAAFVLFSTGNDRTANLRNANTNRIYEPDNRGIDNTAGATVHYDDQVVSYSLSALLTECAKLSGVPVCNLAPPSQTITLGSSATLTASCSNSPNCGTPYSWTSSNPAVAPVPTGTGGSVTPTAAGTYTYTVAGCNEFGTGAPPASATVTVTPPPACGIKTVTVNRGTAHQDIYYKATSGGACTLASSGGVVSLGTQDTTAMQLYRNSSCTQAVSGAGTNWQTNCDSNGDGTVAITCSGNGSNIACTSL